MIEPYQVVGLIQTMRGIRRREEIQTNLDHISHMVKAASWLSSIDLAVRLICIPEGGLQGFTDEVLDLHHETYARECAIDIPGPETDYLGRLAHQWKAYVVAQAKARHPEFPGRFFNVGFVIEPEDGTVIMKHHKLVPLLPVEHSVTPHNVWERWIELYGRELSSFYPVADTEIGRIGIMMANEASYPENARGLAMGGCELAYRGPYPAPGVMSGMFSVQNRARALDNNMYVIGMNLGTYYLDKDSTIPIDTFSGGSQIVDYRGQIVTEVPYGAGSTWIAGTIDIEALRHFRQSAQWDNWLKDLTAEQYQLIYEQVAAVGEGAKRFPVLATVNGYSWRTTVTRMRGEFMLGLNREVREGAGVRAGDTVQVAIELDTAPREIKVPEPLVHALAGDPAAKAAFDALSFTNRKEFARWVADAKRADTRERRLAKALQMLHEGKTLS